MNWKSIDFKILSGAANGSHLHDAHTELSGLVLDLLQLQDLQSDNRNACFLFFGCASQRQTLLICGALDALVLPLGGSH